MDKVEAVQQWRTRMQTIQQQINLLLDTKLTDEQRNWIMTMQENAVRFIQTARDCVEILSQQSDFNLKRASFELRTPITPIIGFARMLSMPEFGEISEYQRELVLSIEQPTGAIAREIHQLMNEPFKNNL